MGKLLVAWRTQGLEPNPTSIMGVTQKPNVGMILGQFVGLVILPDGLVQPVSPMLLAIDTVEILGDLRKGRRDMIHLASGLTAMLTVRVSMKILFDARRDSAAKHGKNFLLQRGRINRLSVGVLQPNPVVATLQQVSAAVGIGNALSKPVGSNPELVGVEMLPSGLSDLGAIARAHTLSSKRRGRINGLEVWDGGRLVIRHLPSSAGGPVYEAAALGQPLP